MKVLFWVDAGPAYGLGHVQRALALADALRARDVTSRLALAPDVVALAAIERTVHAGPVLVPDGAPALAHVLAAANEADAIVVDVQRPLGAEEVLALGGARRVVVIDNDGPGVREADLVVAPFAQPHDARWLTGAAYVPIGPVAPVSTVAFDPPRVLVHLGGDPARAGLAVVEALARLVPTIALTIAASPACATWSALPPVLARHGLPAAVPVEPGGARGLLADADLVVTPFAMEVFEAMGCGVPAIVLSRTDDEAERARLLEAQGAVRSLGLHWTEDSLGAAVAGLVREPGRVAMMRLAGRTLVDGQGAARVADRLVALLRPAAGPTAVVSR